MGSARCAYDQARWRSQAQSAAAGEDNVAIVAVADGRFVGMARGYLGPSEELEAAGVALITALGTGEIAAIEGAAQGVSDIAQPEIDALSAR